MALEDEGKTSHPADQAQQYESVKSAYDLQNAAHEIKKAIDEYGTSSKQRIDRAMEEWREKMDRAWEEMDWAREEMREEMRERFDQLEREVARIRFLANDTLDFEAGPFFNEKARQDEQREENVRKNAQDTEPRKIMDERVVENKTVSEGAGNQVENTAQK